MSILSMGGSVDYTPDLSSHSDSAVQLSIWDAAIPICLACLIDHSDFWRTQDEARCGLQSAFDPRGGKSSQQIQIQVEQTRRIAL